MDSIESFLKLVLDFILFVIVSILFLPSFLIVTYLQPVWQKLLQGLFDL